MQIFCETVPAFSGSYAGGFVEEIGANCNKTDGDVEPGVSPKLHLHTR